MFHGKIPALVLPFLKVLKSADFGTITRGGKKVAWHVLSEQTASASATLDFVLTSFLTDYEDFEFVFHHILAATLNTRFVTRTSTDGGSTYDAAGGNYSYSGIRDNGSAVSDVSSSSNTFIDLTGVSLSGTAANEGVSGRLLLVNPAAVAQARTLSKIMFKDSTGPLNLVEIAGTRLASADVDAIRFLFSSGNIASGKITILGRSKV
jgi:hypothetical protein